MQEKRVVITGTGAITPLGNNSADLWSNIKAGKCGIDYLKGFDDENLQVRVAAQVKDFNAREAGLTMPEIRHSDLFSQYAMAAALEAMADSGLQSGSNIEAERLGVYLGSGVGGLKSFYNQSAVCKEEGSSSISPLFIPMMIVNIAGGNIAIKINAQGPCLSNVAACATSTNSIGEAYLAIRYGRADAIVAGGSEAAVHPLAIGGFANCKALSTVEDPLKASLPFDSKRSGFVMGEGAAVLVLEEYEHAKARGAKIYAEVCGYGHTCDAYHYTAPRPDGSTTSKALKQALSEAGYREGESLYINAHGTGTLLNDKAETMAIKLALGETDAHRASISSSKSMTGHMLGAAGAVELLISAMAVKEGIVPPTIGLTDQDPELDLDYTALTARERKLDIAISDSLGFGGHNVCVALRPVKE